MKPCRKHSRTTVLVFVLCLVPGIAYACVTVDPEIEIGPHHLFQSLAYYESGGYQSFHADAVDPDGCVPPDPMSCWCMQFSVWWPSAAYDIYSVRGCMEENYEWPWGATCKFSETGVYDICIEATDDDDETVSDTWTLEVFSMDLSLSGSPYIGVTQTRTLSLTYQPSNLYAGYKELSVNALGVGRIEVLDNGQTVISGPDDTKERWSLPGPSTVTVRGASPGAATLTLLYTPDGECWPGGNYNGDSVTVTVVKVNIDMLSLPDEQEENPGFYINANWDDDDFDGWQPNETPPNASYTGDKNDPCVYAAIMDPGGDDDFRMFTMDIQPAGVSGNVELTYSTGLAVWETRTKKKPNGQSSFVPSGTQFPASALPPLLYLEGVSGSATFRDKELKATFVPCGASNTVKVTVFEVDLTGFFAFGDQHSDNEVKFSSFGASSDHRGMISWDDADANGTKNRPDPNCQFFHNCMELQGTVKPAGVISEVQFDIKRDRWKRLWRKLENATWGTPILDETNPWRDDDGDNSDESLSVSNDQHIYSSDGPGIITMLRGSGENGWDCYAQIEDFREYVLVKIGGTWYQCSDYYKWHSKIYTEPKDSDLMTRSAMSMQALGAGWVTVPDNP